MDKLDDFVRRRTNIVKQLHNQSCLLYTSNVQVGVADEYIAVVDVNQYRSDMDCFIPLMNKFHDIYGFYRCV